jgi:hypothetical protein
MYTKLFSHIVASSIWNEDDKTRLVWITLLALKDSKTQIVRTTAGSLAHLARVSLVDCVKALGKLQSPDPDGLEQPEQGRRIRPIEHGWLIINGEKYQNEGGKHDRREYQREYMRLYRAQGKENPEKRKGLRKLTLTSVNSVNTNEVTREEKENVVNKGKPLNVEEVVAYCTQNLKLTTNDGKALWEHWLGNGFTNGGKPMKNWKATASVWERRKIFYPSFQPQNQSLRWKK